MHEIIPKNFVMRIILILLLVPFISNAQINRSASELAQENIREYLSTKMFKSRAYKPVSYGELKPNKKLNAEIAWTVEHKFEIADTQPADKNSTGVIHPYTFTFYLDKKLKVLLAESRQQDQ